MPDQYAALSCVRLNAGIACQTPDGLAPIVHAGDPALSVMTDFAEVTPLTIEPGMRLGTAMRKMKAAGMRLLLVPDQDDNIVGIITACDIQGERPVRLSEDMRIPRDDIHVDMLMTPLDKVDAIDMNTVRTARVGDIINTLRDQECQHLLVVDSDRITGDQTIRGVFCMANISRLIGRDVSNPEHVAQSFAEVLHQLR